MSIFRVFQHEGRKMISSKVKALAVVFVLLVLTGTVTVGCSQKAKYAWVNTSSLPGTAYQQYLPKNTKNNSSTVVYLGSDKDSPNVNFGPRDVNFDFRTLK